MDEPTVWTCPASADQPNEDAVFAHAGVAVVVDGAGLPKNLRGGCRHSVSWYAEQIAAAFGSALIDRKATMVDALSRAITQVAGRHEGCSLDQGSPSATVAAWRVSPPLVEYLVLCDASAVILDRNGHAAEITDDRLAVVTAPRRMNHQTSSGSEHPTPPKLLAARREMVEARRNVDGGFWCCHTDPAAAEHALTGSFPMSELAGITIATDGATRGYQSLGIHTVQRFARDSLAGDGAALLAAIRTEERRTRRQLLESATKVHDDATIVAVTLDGPRS